MRVVVPPVIVTIQSDQSQYWNMNLSISCLVRRGVISLVLSVPASAVVWSDILFVIHCWYVSGLIDRTAPVPPVIAPESTSPCVATSTLPATVVLALGCILPAETATHAPHIYW